MKAQGAAIRETHRLVREIGPERVTIRSLARDLKLSAGHLGRIYSRTTGQTLEEYLIRQKLEKGERFLLDPRLRAAVPPPARPFVQFQAERSAAWIL